MSPVSSVARRRPEGRQVLDLHVGQGKWKIPRLVCPLVWIEPGEDGNDGEWEVCRRMIYV